MKNQGFSLIELLLYAALSGVVIAAVSALNITYQQTRIKADVIAEIEQQGVQIVQQVTQAIRDADEITSPAVGSSANSLELTMYDSGVNPTVFSDNSGVIQVCEGGGCSPIDLHNDSVAASAISFENVSRADTPGIVKIQFTLMYANPTSRNEYDYEKTFNASAALR